MHEVNTLRVTAELQQLIANCATHCGVTVSDVLRCTAAGLRSGRPVIQRDFNKRMTNAGNLRLPVRGLALPDDFPLDEFRRVLALRCLEELAKPRTAAPVTHLREGIDYVLLKEKETD